MLSRLRSLLGVGKPRTIRSSLVLLVVACVLPGFLISTFLIFDSYRLQRTLVIRDAVASARAIAAALDRDLSSLESGLHIMAAAPQLAANDLAGFDRHARDALASQNAHNYVLVDAEGNQLINTLRPFGAPLPGRGGPPPASRGRLLRGVFENDTTVLSDLFIGPVTGRPMMTMGVPVHQDGKVVYALSVGILSEHMATLLHRQRLPGGWIGAILDGTGTLIARTHEGERFVGQKAVPQLVSAARQASEGTFESVTLEGIQVIIAFSRSTVSNWTVAIGVPKATLEAELQRSLWMLIAATAALASMGLWLALHRSKRIAGAIHGLTLPALALGTGAEVTVARLRLKEADEVGQALVMASKLLHRTQHEAYHDALTGLANRSLCLEILRQQVSVCERGNLQLAVLYLDLDGFKSVNDTHGHATGDELLQAVARRIIGVIRASDLAVRWGGDEFVVVLFQADAHSAAVVAAKLVESISAPYTLRSLGVEVSTSIGVAVYPQAGNSAEVLVTRADEAMYQAKGAGKARYVMAPSREA